MNSVGGSAFTNGVGDRGGLSSIMDVGQSDGAGSVVCAGDRGGLDSMCAKGTGKGPRKAIGSFGPSSSARKVRGGDRAGISGSDCAEPPHDACNLQVDHSRVSKK